MLLFVNNIDEDKKTHYFPWLAFAWLRYNKDDIEDLEAFLLEKKIITRGGTRFGVDARAVRVSMVDTDQAFNVFINRLATMK